MSPFNRSVPVYKDRPTKTKPVLSFSIIDEKRVSISVPGLKKKLIVQKQDLLALANKILLKLT